LLLVAGAKHRKVFIAATSRRLGNATFLLPRKKSATSATSATHDRGNVAAVAAVAPDVGRDGHGSEATTMSGKMVKGYARFLDGETTFPTSGRG
jgi:hypothetical protein